VMVAQATRMISRYVFMLVLFPLDLIGRFQIVIARCGRFIVLPSRAGCREKGTAHREVPYQPGTSDTINLGSLARDPFHI
jgi:hypothetical protein